MQDFKELKKPFLKGKKIKGKQVYVVSVRLTEYPSHQTPAP